MRYGFRPVLRDLSLEVIPGDPVAIVGPNGAGKSTFVRILAGVLTPTAGTVSLEIDGVEVSDEAHAHTVGLVTPDLQLYPPLTARETLDFLARVRGISREGIATVLDRVGLADRADDLVQTYSTGMRQRLRIATALLHDPPVLLLDEPGATLDPAGRELVARLVADSTRAVVVATNDPEEVALCARSVSVVSSGRKRQRREADLGTGGA